LILRDHSHSWTDEAGAVCEHCGQPLPSSRPLVYGEKKVNRSAIGVAVALHVLILAAIILHKTEMIRLKPPAGGQMVYVAPLQGAGKPKTQKAETAPAKRKPTPAKPKRQQAAVLPHRENTITMPLEPAPEPPQPAKEPPKPMTPVDPSMDMAAAIEARRRARGEASAESQGESDSDRAMRRIQNNIAAANNAAQGDPNDTGGIFSVTDQTFSSAKLKFRGWNTNFKRRWLTQVNVERGGEPDIETAIIKKMIELIRREKTGDFEWDSHRLGKVVTMSARPQDQEVLETFLFKEMFPKHRRAMRG
jgi:hypothetical protein